MRTPYSPTKDKPSLGQKLLRISLPHDWHVVTSERAGYCYLCLYEEEYHQKVAFLLGSYPKWLNVKNLGGFRETGTFNTIRVKNNVVHISTDGIGVPSRELSMDAREIVGGSLSLYGSGYFVPTWPVAIAIWIIRIFVITCRWETTPIALFVSASLVSPAWVAMIFCGGVLYPTPAYLYGVLRFRKMVYSKRIFSEWRKLLSLATMGCLMVHTEARMAIHVDHYLDQINDAKTEEIAVMRDFHPKYMAVFDVSTGGDKLCTNDYNIMGDALDLDVDDHILIQYLEAVCKPLVDMDNWRYVATKHYTDDRRFDPKKYVKDEPGYPEQMAVSVSKEAVVAIDATKEFVQSTLDGSKKLLNLVDDETQLLGCDLIEETEMALKSTNVAIVGAARGINKVIDKRSKAIEPLIDDLDNAITVLVDTLPSATDVATSVKGQVDNISDLVGIFNEHVEVKLGLLQFTKKMWNVGSTVTNDFSEIGTTAYKQGIDRVKLQLTESDEDPRPYTVTDVYDAGKVTVNSFVAAGEGVTKYIRDAYADNNVKENTSGLINEGPWLTETLGVSIGKFPSGILKGSGLSEVVTEFVGELRKVTIGDVDTPTQRDKNRELDTKVKIEQARNGGNVLNMFRWWNSGVTRKKRAG